MQPKPDKKMPKEMVGDCLSEVSLESKLSLDSSLEGNKDGFESPTSQQSDFYMFSGLVKHAPPYFGELAKPLISKSA